MSAASADRTITVAVPPETFEPFRRRAEQADQSVEEAVLQAMRAALAESEAEGRRALLSALELLDTPVLWGLVRRGAETEEVLLLAALNEKRQRAGLTADEERAVRELIRHHDRAMLLRAKALALLRQWGEDVRSVIDGA